MTELTTQLNHLVSLAKWLSVRLRIKCLWVRVPLQSLKFYHTFTNATRKLINILNMKSVARVEKQLCVGGEICLLISPINPFSEKYYFQTRNLIPVNFRLLRLVKILCHKMTIISRFRIAKVFGNKVTFFDLHTPLQVHREESNQN